MTIYEEIWLLIVLEAQPAILESNDVKRFDKEITLKIAIIPELVWIIHLVVKKLVGDRGVK